MKRRGHHTLRHRDNHPNWTREFDSSTASNTTNSDIGSGGGIGGNGGSGIGSGIPENFLNLGAANSSTLFPELGAFSSLAPSSSSGFGYSQKNFHISDGNLYSVLSPFQARRSSARPSFLKGQSCVTSTTTTTTSTSDVNRDSLFASGSSRVTGNVSSLDTGRRISTSKLKFHHQDMPPPYGEKNHRRTYRTAKSTIHGGEDSGGPFSSSTSSSSWFDEPPFAMDTDRTSLLSKRLKSQRATLSGDDIARDVSEDRFFRHHDEWETEELSLNSRRSFRHRYHLLDSKSTSSAGRNDGTWAFDDEDEDDDEEEDEEQSRDNRDSRVPLNLCLADRQRKLSSMRKDLDERLRRKVDSESQMGFPFDRDFPRDRKFSLSSLFDDLSTRSSLSTSSKSRSQEGSEFFKTSHHVQFEEEEPRVLDLSMKQPSAHQSNRRSNPNPSPSPGPSQPPPPPTPCMIVCPDETVIYPQSPQVQSCQFDSNDWKRTKFPLISEMFQNMRLQDDDFMQDAVKRYNATRQLLMQTHPEMFGYDWTRTNLLQEINKPSEDIVSPPRPSKDVVGVGETSSAAAAAAAERPRSWDESLHGFNVTSPGLNKSETPRIDTPKVCGGRGIDTNSFLSPTTIVQVPLQMPQRSDGVDRRRRDEVATSVSTSQQLPPLIPSASYSLVQQTQWQSQNHSQTTRRSASAPSIAANAASGRVTRGRHGETKIKVATEVPGGGALPKATKSSRQRKNVVETPSSQYSNDISICKFKLIKGANPMLEEKKSFFVPLNRSSSSQCQPQEPISKSGLLRSSSSQQLRSYSNVSTAATTVTGTATAAATTTTATAVNNNNNTSTVPFFVLTSVLAPSCSTSATSSGAIGDKFRTYKIHVGSQEEMGRKLAAAGKQRLRRRSRKALAREKLEATFREQGFLIKTQQVSSAEGAVYCKFRQLRKFTRYLFKSWKDYLPKELDDMAVVNPPSGPPQQPP